MLLLSSENVATVFKTGVLTKRGVFSFYWWLGIPDNIAKDPLSAAYWWVRHGEDRRWRRIIFALDDAGETAIADELMPYSEPPSGV